MDLPPELISDILYYLTNEEYLHCYCASQVFHVLTTREHFERGSLLDLPPELISEILYYLTNVEYLHCYASSQVFHVLTTREHFKRTVIVEYIYLDPEERRLYAQISDNTGMGNLLMAFR